jgi:hypothetical protein
MSCFIKKLDGGQSPRVVGWNSAVGTATRCGLDGPGTEARWGRNLSSGEDGGERSGPRTCHLNPSTYRAGSWVRPTDFLSLWRKKTVSVPRIEPWSFDCPVRNLATKQAVLLLFRWYSLPPPPPQMLYTRWFKSDREWLCVNKFVPVIFEPPCTLFLLPHRIHIEVVACLRTELAIGRRSSGVDTV